MVVCTFPNTVVSGKAGWKPTNRGPTYSDDYPGSTDAAAVDN